MKIAQKAGGDALYTRVHIQAFTFHGHSRTVRSDSHGANKNWIPLQEFLVQHEI